MNEKVSIVILNWNGKESTLECLESLQKLKKDLYTLAIIVVDNASSDDSVNAISKQFPKIKLIENKENLGFSGGNNVGIEYALQEGSDYVMVLNNDTTVKKNLLLELLDTYSQQENAGIVSPKIYFSPGREFHKERYKKEDLGRVIWYAGGQMDWNNVIGSHRGVDEVDHGQFDSQTTIDYSSGCCMFIKREVLEKVGLFDNRYYLYYEDADLSERVKRSGYSILFAPQAIVWHKNADSAGGSGSKLQDYYISRNRLLFGVVYAPLRSKIALFKESWKLVRYGREWQKKGVLDFYFRKFGRGSFNL